MRRFLLALLLTLACGQEPGTDALAAAAKPPTGAIRVRPATATLEAGGVQAFTVSPASLSVTWSVREAGGGSVTQTGLYTAPSAAGTYHVVATHVNLTGEATVTVTAPPVVITATSPVDADACRAVQLSATVINSSNTTVLWSMVDPACGSVTSSGSFTSVRGNGTCDVRATAAADTTKTAIITMIVTERVLSVAVTPVTISLGYGGTQQFVANVTTTCGTFPATPG